METGKAEGAPESAETKGGGKLRARRPLDQGARWARFGGSLLLLIVVGFGSYFFVYVGGRSERIDQYNLRLLSTAAENVRDVLLGREENALSAVKPVDGEGLEAEDPVSAETLAHRLTLIPHFKRSTDRKEIKRVPGEVDGQESESGQTGISVVPFLADWPADAELRFVFDDPDYEPSPSEADAKVPKWPQVWGAKLRDLVEPTLPTEMFDVVALARGDRTVLLQQGRSKLHLSHIPSAASKTVATATETNTQGDDTSIREIEFGGQKYRMYVRPFRVPISLRVPGPGGDAEGSSSGTAWFPVEDEWLLVGLVPNSTVRREAMLIAPTIVIPVVGFLMLGVLILPYLKVRLIGPREALRAADVLSLGVSIVLMGSLVTTGLLYVHVRGQLSGEQEARLRSLSQAVKDRIRAELDALETQLAELSRKHRSELAAAGADGKVGSKNKLLVDETVAPLSYPFFQIAFWVDGKGNQSTKWTVKSSTTATLNVAERPYFKRALGFELWPSAAERGGADHQKQAADFVPGRFVESVRSRNTGESLAMLSLRFRDPALGSEEAERDSAQREVVAVIVARLLSLIGPTLPPDHGFAVLGQDGTVLFHSDEERNLHENFLEEVEPRAALEAAMFGGQERSFEVEYRTKALLVNVSPVMDTPWTLAVFVDQDVVRTRRLEILTLAVVLFVALLAVLLLVALWLHVTSSTPPAKGAVRLAWFWPWPDRRFEYWVITLTMFFTIVSWTLAVLVGETLDARFPAFQAVLALAMVWLVLQRTSGEFPQPRNPYALDRTAGFVGLVAGVLLALAQGDELRRNIWIAFIAIGVFVFLSRRPSLLVGYLIAMGVFVAGLGTWSVLKIPSVGASFLYACVLWVHWGKTKPRLEALMDRLRAKMRSRRWRRLLRRIGVPGLYPSPDAAYLACAASVLVVISVLPSITFFRAVYDEVGIIFSMREQLEFANELSERPGRVLRLYDDTVTRTVVDGKARELEGSTSVQTLLPSEPPPTDDSCPACWNVARAFDVYARIDGVPSTPDNDLWLSAVEIRDGGRGAAVSPCAACMDTSSEEVGGATGSEPPTDAGVPPDPLHLLEPFRVALPSYSTLARSVRELADLLPSGEPNGPGSSAGATAWPTWKLEGDGRLVLWVDGYRRPIQVGLIQTGEVGEDGKRPTRARGLSESDDRIDLRVASTSTEFSFGHTGWWILVGIVALGVLCFLLQSIAERAFLVRLRLPRILSLPSRPTKLGRRELWLRPDEAVLERLLGERKSLTLDSARLRDEEVLVLVSEAKAFRGSRVVVQAFEVGLREPPVAKRKLELLEELLDLHEKDIAVCSEMEPLYFFTALDVESQVIGTTAELNRWAAALVQFEKSRGDARDLHAVERRAELFNAIQLSTGGAPAAEYLVDECWPDPFLRHLAGKLALSGACRDLTREEVVDVVLDHSEAYYRTVFGTCSREERVLLYRLAQDGFVNWHVTETLRRLIRRGLVQHAAGFPLMNESFRRFVLIVESPADVREWEMEGSAGVWSRMRTPVTMALGVLVVFLYFTQRQSFDETIGLVAALATGWPAAVNLLARLSQKRQT